MPTLRKLIVLLAVLTLFEVTNSYRYTNYSKNGGGDIWYLQYHNVNCPKGSALSYLKFEQRSNDDIRYKYDCRSSGIIYGTERTKTTGWWYINDGDYVDGMAGLSLYCEDDEALSQFNMVRSGNNVRYSYTCVGAKLYGSIGSGITYQKCYYNCENEDMDNLYISLSSHYLRQLTYYHKRYEKSKQYFGWQYYYIRYRNYNNDINSYVRPQ